MDDGFPAPIKTESGPSNAGSFPKSHYSEHSPSAAKKRSKKRRDTEEDPNKRKCVSSACIACRRRKSKVRPSSHHTVPAMLEKRGPLTTHARTVRREYANMCCMLVGVSEQCEEVLLLMCDVGKSTRPSVSTTQARTIGAKVCINKISTSFRPVIQPSVP